MAASTITPAATIGRAQWLAGAPRLTVRGRAVAVGILTTVLVLLVLRILLAAAASQPISAGTGIDGASLVAVVPGAELAREGRAVAYTVRSGDTLWDLAVAQRTGEDPRVVVDRIQELSGRGNSVLVVGERLYLPVP